ncbi:MAG: acyl-CoA dehydrogenase [Candidatus Fischerbacteria bacterium RBG_13_37_8]|uniref:Acyl-CoA dehydrogenase n=1 Tax=Candidatus Fischerbacteria bacterium RBG_13_37_8 TaxID=1817863 RepID=A0A1F5V5J6_9BACT|nr:MAG: acyl-CoA dehydrogenase [Candidatus Fischerbacteria bacterium RBG_13_37_8]
MKIEFTEDQLCIRQMVRDVMEKEVLPHVETWESNELIPKEIFPTFAELGLFGMVIPETYGGAGIDYISSCLVIEEIARISASLAITISVHNSVGCYPVFKYGTDTQKQKYLLPLIKGEKIGCFAITEPNAGSDVAAIKTKAVKDGDTYILNGTKAWVTNGGFGGIAIIQAITDPAAGPKGISSFIVDSDSKGFIISKKEDKMGIRASATNEIILEDCRIPSENLLGKEGMGMRIALDALDGGRIGVAAQAIGISVAAVEKACEYAKARTSFGQNLADHQAIQFMLADAATKIESARLLTLKAAYLKDNNLRCAKEAAMAKLFASEASIDVTYKALQIFGAYGYSKEFPLERYSRDARVTTIYEGTSEIQRIVIAREILKAL